MVRLPAATAQSGPSLLATSSSGSRTESMEPLGSSCMSLPLAATRVRASSRENTPARQAATNSPMLWPIMASWRMAPGV